MCRLVSRIKLCTSGNAAHAQWTIVNGVPIKPPRNVEHSSWCYYRMQAVMKHDLWLVIYGILSIPNLINFRPAIPLQMLKNEYHLWSGVVGFLRYVTLR
jgi:hypothetical protein